MHHHFVLIFLLFSFNAAAFNVATYNIRNFDYDVRMRSATNKPMLAETLNSLTADLVAIQEINKTDVFKNFIANNLNGYKAVLSKCGGAHSQHLGFIYKTSTFELLSFKEDARTSNPKGKRPFCNDGGSRPLAIAHFKDKQKGHEIIAISVHLKSGSRDSSIYKRFDQLEIVADLIDIYRRQGHTNFVVMGDFNSTEFINRGKYYHQFEQLVHKMKLQDLTSELKCTSYWWGNRNDRTQYPTVLDHILISPELIAKHRNWQSSTRGYCEKLRCELTAEQDMGNGFDEISDHCPLVVEFQ